MEYVCHRRFKGKAMCLRDMNIPRGFKFKLIADKFITTEDGKAICYKTSEIGCRNFARNDDGNGLRRGDITYAIAYGPKIKNNGEHLNEDDWKIFLEKCKPYIKDVPNVILFNTEFFHADIDVLEDLVKSIDLKVEEGS